VRRDWVEGAEMQEALSACGAPVVAAYCLAGGVLTGKYDGDPNAGRATGQLDQPMFADAVKASAPLADLARRLATTPAALAVAFALGNPEVATVLFGATSPDQVATNLAAVDVATRLTDEQRAELAAIGR
jgi:aryl-alcohol dehydrogenase-like predicted oxidoreductase